MPEKIKYIDLKEFHDFGYLQEVNRQFLHIFGLALELRSYKAAELERIIRHFLADDVDDRTVEDVRQLLRHFGIAPSIVSLGGVWDYRDDPEGIRYADGVIEPAKTERVWKERGRLALSRMEHLGYIVQPVSEEVPESGS